MYCRDSDELDSSICKRFCTDLKNDSCMVGLAGCDWVELEDALDFSEAVKLFALVDVWVLSRADDDVEFGIIIIEGTNTLFEDAELLVCVGTVVVVSGFIPLNGEL
jgi:hypothetical protein